MPDPDPARERRALPCTLRGDEDTLYRTHAHRLRQAVARRNRGVSPDQVEDACATAWLILLRVQPRRETIFGWLFVVAVHETWRLAAADRMHAPVLRDLDDGVRNGVLDPPGELRDPLARVHARELLREIAETLPRRQLEAIALRAYGYSYDEIGELTGATWRTVDRQLRRGTRALDALRDSLAA
jgi:DNA-directed RNA polymerase specialized sigma24 family protein